MKKIKSTSIWLAMVSIFLLLGAAEKPKLVKTKVNENLSIMVPKEWIAMDGMDFTQRYPSVRAPLAAYTNQERTVDFSVNISATQWPDANLEMSKKFFKASLMNMFDRVDILDEGIHEVSKKKLIFFEFESRVEGNKKNQELKDPILKYTYVQYLIEPNRTLVFSFNCPRRMKDEWQETAHAMMSGLKLK